MNDEMLEIVNDKGEVLGIELRSKIHGNPSLIHKVVHVLVINKKGEVLLQKRSMNKDVAPGRWDTSAGGHVSPGEDSTTAALRELEEELGFSEGLEYLYSYTHSNPYETELVYTFSCIRENGFMFNKEEIDEIRFFGIEEIKEIMYKGILSDNFEHEIKTYLSRTS